MTASRYVRHGIGFATGIAVLAAVAGVGPTGLDMLVSPADAVIGRPLTPLSYAGVARRTTYRAAVYGSYYGAAAANAAAARAATNAATVYPPGTVVYVAPPAGCVKIVDPYGAVTYRCP
jgi:hypothetical protein